MKFQKLILINMLLICCLLCGQQVLASTEFESVSTPYQPILYVATSLNVASKDFASPENFYYWQQALENEVHTKLKAYSLPQTLRVVFNYKSTYEDIFNASHNSDVVGIILIAHNTQSAHILNGQMLDAFGNSIDSAFLGSDPNLRALALMSCYSSVNMDALAALQAIGPYTFKISYSRKSTDIFDIPGSLRSVLRHLKRTELTWQNLKIKSLSQKISVQFSREFVCKNPNQHELSAIAIRIGSETLGIMPTFKSCNLVQKINLNFSVPLSQNAIISIKAIQDETNKSPNIGELRIEDPYKFRIVKSTNGIPLGAPTENSYRFFH